MRPGWPTGYRSSAPHSCPSQIPPQVVELIEGWRREHKWSARKIAVELAAMGHRISVATVGRWLVRLGINRRRDLDPTGTSNRRPGTITARYPGHMVHLDVKKVGRIPDGGGWWAHGRDSEAHRAARRASAKQRVIAKNNGGAKVGYVFLHSAVDGFSRLVYTEHLPDETAAMDAYFRLTCTPPEKAESCSSMWSGVASAAMSNTMTPDRLLPGLISSKSDCDSSPM
ncbi:hypothetical protein HEB94_000853 [Actinopolymorpha pittospori]|uniref:Uncharacterized protein n=1 Tax=Actinopolymorpha pittospori TaxID=648752 RepID=A0A927R9I3_9ACTN|nr:hypothetical protein [Actinopolymorpha pittospori]